MVSEWSVLRLGDETLTVGPYVWTGRPHLGTEWSANLPGEQVGSGRGGG